MVKSTEYILNLLHKTGLTEAEAKVYLALLKKGSGSGYEASKQAGVPRSKIYNMLESMVIKGFVLYTEAESGNRYAAVPMEEIAERIQWETQETLEELKKELQDYEGTTDLEHIWHIREYGNVFAKCREVIKRTKRELLLQIWDEDLGQVQKELEELEKQGIRVGLVLFSEEDKELSFRNFCRHGMLEEKREEMGGRFVTLVSDLEEAVFGQIVEEHTAEVIWTKSKPMVAMAAECVRHDFYFYRSAGVLKEEMQEKLGYNFSGARKIFTE